MSTLNDSKTMGSLANKLLGYVNTATVHDANFDIAVAMIKNYKKLRNMSIQEIADLCYHVMVLMVQSGISLEDVTRELSRRHVVDHKVKQEHMQ